MATLRTTAAADRGLQGFAAQHERARALARDGCADRELVRCGALVRDHYLAVMAYAQHWVAADADARRALSGFGSMCRYKRRPLLSSADRQNLAQSFEDFWTHAPRQVLEATHDDVGGILNRARFLDLLEKAC